MPRTTDSINRELYELLKAKHFYPSGIKKGEKSVKPEEATGFNFKFKVDDTEYGSAHVVIDNLENLILFFNKNVVKEAGKKWAKFCSELKTWAMKRGLGFKIDPIDNLNDYIAKKEYHESLNEGYYGTRQTSYSDRTPDTIKIIIKHNKSLTETDRRYHYIERIFVENADGERFLLPTKKPSVAEAFARLIADGGNPYDERGRHITEISEDINKLGAFVRATRNKQFNESANQVVSQAVEQYTTLRETMKRLRSSRGFKKYFENWQPTLMEAGDVSALESAFKVSNIDSRISNALPVLGKFGIKFNEMTEAQEFENWANNVIEEDLNPTTEGQVDDLVSLLGGDSDELPLGPDASNVIGQLMELVEDEGLFDRLTKAAKGNPNLDARPIIIGWMSEHSNDEVYKKILDRLDSEENTSSTEPTVSPASTPSPENPPPVPPATSEPQTAPEIKESSELQHVLRLSGLRK